MNLTREVIVIPATIKNGIRTGITRQHRVASYSRVSTDFEDQLTSFHAQKTYYTDLILRTPEWTLAGCYADEGISGATAEKRPDFMKMIRHCKKGKIDLIITKSISRFARNTLDSIGYVRKLKAMGIGVLFEKEGINTLEENSEVILTILSSLAQEELNSISQNVKMGKRMAMQDGIYHWNYSQSYGYRKGADGNPEPIPEQAEVIRRIYTLYLQGRSEQTIMHILNDEEIPTSKKNGQWTNSTIQGILKNERFCGDVILQKTYVVDPISKKTKVNNGELPKYLIKNHHTPIVSREVYDKAQQERARRNNKKKVTKVSTTEQSRYSSLYALNDILICGHCCTPYKRVTWRKRNGEKQIVWRCISRLDHGKKYCQDSVSVDEQSLHTAILEAINQTSGNPGELAPILIEQVKQEVQASAPQLDNGKIEQELKMLNDKIMDMMMRTDLPDRYEKIKVMNDQMVEMSKQIEQQKSNLAKSDTTATMMNNIDTFMSINAESHTETYTEYNDTLVRQLIHTIKVIDEHTIKIYFKCGTQYTQSVQAKVKPLKKAT